MTANAQTYSSITPSRCIAVADENPAIWYPMHDGAGTTLAEALGLGPSMTLAGTTPGNGWTNAGLYTPNGSNNVATCAANSHVNSVMSLANIAAGGMLIIGCEVQLDSASATQQYIHFWGRDSSTAGYGGWGMSISTADAFNVLVRGNGAGSSNNTALGVQIGDTHTAPVKVLVVAWFEGNYLRIEMRQSGTVEPGNIGSNQLDLTGLTHQTAASDGLTLMARRTSAGTPSTGPLGGGSSGARINNWFVQRRAQYSSLIADDAYADMLAAGREFPRSLRG